MNRTKHLTFLLAILALIFSISFVQEIIAKPILVSKINEYNKNKSNKYTIYYKNLNLKIPFCIKADFFGIIQKSNDTPLVLCKDIFAIINPGYLMIKKIGLISMSIDSCSIGKSFSSGYNNRKSEDALEYSIPPITIASLSILNIYGADNFIPDTTLGTLSLSCSIKNLGKNLQIIGYITDRISKGQISYSVHIDSSKEISIRAETSSFPNFAIIKRLKSKYLSVEAVNSLKVHIKTDMKQLLKTTNIFITCDLQAKHILDPESSSVFIKAIIHQEGTRLQIKECNINTINTYSSINGFYNIDSTFHINAISSVFKNVIIDAWNTFIISPGKLSFDAIGELHAGKIEAGIDLDNIIWKTPERSISFTNTKLNISSSYNKQTIRGTVKLISKNYDIPIEANSVFSISNTEQGLFIDLTKSKIFIDSCNAKGNLSILQTDSGIIPNGNIYIEAENLSELSYLINKNLWGSLTGNISIFGIGSDDIKMFIKMRSSGIKIFDISAEDIFLSSKLCIDNKLNHPNIKEFSLTTSGKSIISKSAQIKEIEALVTMEDSGRAAGYVYSSGFFKKPYNIYAGITSKIDENCWSFDVDYLEAVIDQMIVYADDTIHFDIENKEKLYINKSRIHVGPSGIIDIDGSPLQEEDIIIINANNIPLSIYSDNQIENDYHGNFNLDMTVSNNLANAFAKIQSEIVLTKASENDGINISLDTNINLDTISSKIRAIKKGKEIGNISANIPISTIFPVSFIRTLPYYSFKHSGEIDIRLNGYFDTLLSNIVGVDISGYISSETSTRFNLENNSVNSEGYLKIIDGSLHMAEQGIHVEKIQAEILLNGSDILINNIIAQDDKFGNMNLKGEISMTNDNLLYFINMSANKFNIINLPHLSMTLHGRTIYEGNLEKGVISGHLSIIDMSASVDHPTAYIRPKVFAIDDVYDYKLSKTQETIEATINKLPRIMLDISVDTENPAYFYGLMMSSYWHGHFMINGTIQSPIFEGSMSLNEGQIKLAHRIFKFNFGKISWEKSQFDKYALSAVGELEISGHHIFTNLSINNNKWDLQMYSTPYLTQGDIASMLIFGKKISDPNEEINMGDITSTIWDMTTHLYRGAFYQFVRNNIKVDTQEFNNSYRNKNYGNISVKTGFRYKDLLFSGVSYYSLTGKYKPTIFANINLLNSSIRPSAFVGPKLLGGSLEIEFAF